MLTKQSLFFGVNDAHLKVIERELNVSIVTRGETVHVSGAVETVALVEKILQQLLVVIRKSISISERCCVCDSSLHNKGKLLNLKSYMRKKFSRLQR